MCFDYVTRRPDALSDGLIGRLRGLTFAETPLNAIFRFTWSLEASEARPLLKAPRQNGSSFRADLEQSTQMKKPVNEIRSAQNRAYSTTGRLHKPLETEIRHDKIARHSCKRITEGS